MIGAHRKSGLKIRPPKRNNTLLDLKTITGFPNRLEIEWGIRGRLEQLFPQITDVATHRITFISDCVLAPYSLINLLIGKDTVSVCHQKAEDFIFLHCRLNLLIVTIYFSLVHVNFKTGK